MNFLFKIIIIKFFFIISILDNNLLAQNTKIIAKVGGEIVTSFELENKIKTTLFLAGEDLTKETLIQSKTCL